MKSVIDWFRRFYAYIAISSISLLALSIIYYVIVDQINPFSIIGLALSVILLVLAGFFGRLHLQMFMSSRGLKYNIVSGILIAIVIVIIAFLSVILHTYKLSFDLTHDKVYSLSPQTKQVIKKISEPVTIINFYRADPRTSKNPRVRRLNAQYRKYVSDLVAQYREQSEMIKSKTLDPEESPQLARKYRITNFPTVVFLSGGKVIEANAIRGGYPGEQEFTNALIKLQTTVRKSIYFLEGHGEASIDGQANGTSGSLKIIKQALVNDNHIVSSLNLQQQEMTIPQRCNLLVVAGPMIPISQPERRVILDYLKRGGEMIVLTAAGFPGGIRPTGLEKILADEYMVRISDRFVLDPRSCYRKNPLMLYVFRRRGVVHPSPINTGINRLFMPFSVHLEKQRPQNRRDNISVTPLLSASRTSYAKTIRLTTAKGKPRKLSADNLKYNKKTDEQGPSLVAALSRRDWVFERASNDINARREQDVFQSHVLVIGNINMLTDSITQQPWGNTNFFVNSVNFLVGAEELLSIPPKDPVSKRLALNEAEKWFIILFSLIVLPGSVLVVGIVIWLRRRNA